MFCLNPRYRFIKPKIPDNYKLVNGDFIDPDSGDVLQFSKYAGQYVKYPCGKCSVCIKRARSEWTKRLNLELLSCTQSFFITLTYDDVNLPYTYDFINKKTVPCFSKRHLQLFNKSLRYYLFGKSPQILKYYLVCEYGSLNGRPHYHGIYFITSDEYYDLDKLCTAIQSSWQKGDINVQLCSQGSIHYVTKYNLKYDYLFHNIDKLSDFDENGNKSPDLRVKPFSLISKRPYIGSNFVTDSRFNKSRSFTISGHKYGLPRIIKNKLGIEPLNVHLLENRFDERFTPEEYFKLYNNYVSKFGQVSVTEFHKFLDNYCKDIDDRNTKSFLRLDKV